MKRVHQKHWAEDGVKSERLLMRLVGTVGLTAALSGCVTYRDASSVEYVGLDHASGEGTSLGRIEGRDCATTVFGFGRSIADLSINNALERSRKEAGLRYLKGMSVERQATNIFVYNRTCIVVAGMGYK